MGTGGSISGIKAAALSFAIALMFPAGALAAPQLPGLTPAQFVQNLGDTALSSLTDKNTPPAVREQRVRELLENNFDIQTIGRFAMGPYWRDASDVQRGEYLSLFENNLVSVYSRRFEDYAGQTLQVSEFTPSGDTDYIVSSQVLQQSGPAVNVEWRVRREAAGLRIVDVVVEGISMSVTQRADFASVIQHSGGAVDALLTTLRAQGNHAS